MPVGKALELRQPTSTGEAQVRYQIQQAVFTGDVAAISGEVVHDTPAEAASDLFVKAKFTVNGQVRETTQQIPLGNKEVIEISEQLDAVPPNAEVGFAVQAAEPGEQISENLIFYDFVTAAESAEAESLQPQAVEAGIESLRMEPGGATLTPGEERTLVIRGVAANGETFPLTDGLSFTSSNPGVVTVDADGRLEAFGRGSAAVTATFDGGIGEPSITENFTVEPPQDEQPEEPGPGPGPAPAPEEPEPINPELPNLNPEPGVYVLPFSVLNAAPFLTGVPDVTIRIPTELSIENIVDRVTLSQSEAETAARDGVEIPEPADPPAEDDIFAEFTDGEPFESVPTLEELRTELDAAVDSIDIPDPPAVEDITDPVDSTIDALQQDLEGFIDDTETFLDGSISETEAVLDDTLSGIDSAVSDAQDSIDTALEDIDSGFSDVQDTLAETQESIPSLEDIVADTTAAVITGIEAQIIPTQEGVLLTDDPPRFFAIALENFLQEALSAETQQRARERAQEGQ